MKEILQCLIFDMRGQSTDFCGINGDHFWSDLISASSHVSVEGKGELMDKLLYITYCVYLHRLTIKYNVSLFVIISVNINKLIISFLSSFIVL